MHVIKWKRKRAYGNFSLLLSAREEQSFPYLPEYLARVPHHMIDTRSVPDWSANDWFYATHLLRGMVRSDMPIGRVVDFRRAHPELFDPWQAVRLSALEIDEQLKEIFGTVPPTQRYGEAWRRNSESLIAAWGGDILTVYKGVTTEAEVRARIVNKENYKLPIQERGFYGFKEKMCALLTINLMQAELIPRISMSFPVDFHHMRVLIGTGMIELQNGSYLPDSIMAVGDGIGRAYLDRFSGVDPVVFSELLFVLSREGCRWAVADPHADWDNPTVVRRYRQSCGRCPLEWRCHQTTVPDDYYVRDGRKGSRLITVISRPKPPKGL